jgi:6-phosphogluconolactonase
MNILSKSFQNEVNQEICKITAKQRAAHEEDMSIMLTGGHSAEMLYKSWVGNSPFTFSKSTCYFGDERSVPPGHPDSNYGMTISALFPDGIIENCKIERIRGEETDRDIEAGRYSKLLPESVDLLLLSVGTDGHIASLFPHSEALNESERIIVPITGPTPPSKRLTITPRVIKSAKKIVVMAAGNEKGRVLAKALEEPDNIMELPVRLTIGSTWVLDETAARAFQTTNQCNHYNTRMIYA